MISNFIQQLIPSIPVAVGYLAALAVIRMWLPSDWRKEATALATVGLCIGLEATFDHDIGAAALLFMLCAGLYIGQRVMSASRHAKTIYAVSMAMMVASAIVCVLGLHCAVNVMALAAGVSLSVVMTAPAFRSTAAA